MGFDDEVVIMLKEDGYHFTRIFWAPEGMSYKLWAGFCT